MEATGADIPLAPGQIWTFTRPIKTDRDLGQGTMTYTDKLARVDDRPIRKQHLERIGALRGARSTLAGRRADRSSYLGVVPT